MVSRQLWSNKAGPLINVNSDAAPERYQAKSLGGDGNESWGSNDAPGDNGGA
jgi:hypothetical protein